MYICIALMVRLAILASILSAFVGISSQFECKYDGDIIGKQQAIFDTALSQPLVSRQEAILLEEAGEYVEYDYLRYTSYDYPLDLNCEWN